ncbi:MAG TPA: XRE family transcriptional regulator [Limnochordia bacterium]|nr:XRE family transcriptional regulator [Limnochordia bacterium]
MAGFRQRRNLTLRRLGEMAEVSGAYISQIENGHTSPSLAVLERLAEALGVHVVDLLEEGHDIRPDEVLVRRDARPAAEFRYSGADVRYLVPPGASRRMRALHLTIPPGDATRSPHVHSGEDFGYVLRGEVELRLGERTLPLAAGDAFSFPGVRPHGFANRGAEPAELIWIVNAPELDAPVRETEPTDDAQP